MADQYFIKDYVNENSSPKMNYAEKAAKRKRFDSVSTNSSCGDNNANQQQQQYDSRFEPRIIPEVQYNNGNTKSSTSMGCSSMSSTGKRGSYLSASSQTYQIILSIRINSDEPNEDYIYRCFPEVEMVLDDEVTVESVTREIIEKLNMKMVKELKNRDKSLSNTLKTCELIHAVNGSEECFEISQASKDGEPKGCSFDRNQTLRLIKCKPRLCLKVLNSAAYEPIIFKLLNKQPTPMKKYDFDGSTIQEQEDDFNSIARACSHYKDSLIQKEMDYCVINQHQNSSFSQQPTRSSQISSTIQKQEVPVMLDNSQCAPQKKKVSRWRKIFCGVICQ